MRVLVTRPEADARVLSERLERHGHVAVIDPLLAVETGAIGPRDVDGIEALAATSRHALDAFADGLVTESVRRLPLYVVGTATEARAREIGFANVIRGPGTAADLADTILAGPAGQGARPILYLAGADLAFDLRAALEARHRRVRQVTVYRTVAATRLRDATVALLAAGGLDAVLLMSPRTARVWRDLARAAGLDDAIRRLPHLCLSPAVAAALTPDPPSVMRAARQPTIEELLALIQA